MGLGLRGFGGFGLVDVFVCFSYRYVCPTLLEMTTSQLTEDSQERVESATFSENLSRSRDLGTSRSFEQEATPCQINNQSQNIQDPSLDTLIFCLGTKSEG